MQDCPLVSVEGLHRRLEVELGAPIAIATDDATGAMRLVVRCDGSEVSLELHPGDGVVQRRVPFESERESGRRRLVAVAATEMVMAILDAEDRAPEPEPEPEPEPVPEPARPPPAPVEPPVPEVPPPRFAPYVLRAAAMGRTHTDPVAFSFGPALGVDWLLPPNVLIGGELHLGAGREEVARLGHVRLFSVVATLRLGLRLPFGDWGYGALTIGGSLGYGRLGGVSNGAAPEGIVAGPVLGPQVAISTLVPLAPTFGLQVGLAIDWWGTGVIGLGPGAEPVARLEGTSVALTVGLALRPRR